MRTHVVMKTRKKQLHTNFVMHMNAMLTIATFVRFIMVMVDMQNNRLNMEPFADICASARPQK